MPSDIYFPLPYLWNVMLQTIMIYLIKYLGGIMFLILSYSPVYFFPIERQWNKNIILSN